MATRAWQTGGPQTGGWVAAALATVMALGLGGAPAAAATAGCPSSDDIRVMMFAALFNNMVTYVANDGGFYTRNCLTATLVPVNSGPAGLAQLQAGSIQFSDSSFDNILVARHRGLPIKVVVGESSGIVYSLVASKALPTPHQAAGYPAVMQDLVGKRVGVFGLGTGSELFVRTLLRGAGLAPDAVTFIAVGSTPTQLAALENDGVDAVIMGDPGQDIAVAQGIGRIIVDLRKPDVGPPEVRDLAGIFQIKVATDSYITEHPDTVRRFVKANQEAVDWIHDPANHAALVKIMQHWVPIGNAAPISAQAFDDLVKIYAGFSTATIKRSSAAGWNTLQVHAGNIPAAIPFDEVVWSGAPSID